MADRKDARLVDLSHLIEDGMTTYKGLPGPHICDYLDARAVRPISTTTARPSRSAASTWSPIPAPISTRPSIASRMARTLPGWRWSNWRRCPASSCARTATAIDAEAFAGLDVAGKAVLVHTGWDRHWRTDAYQTGHPFLTEAAARAAGRGRREAGRHRQPQYRRYIRPLAPRPHRPARRGHADLRAYDQSRRAARERLHLHRRPAEDRRHGHLPGARLCCSHEQGIQSE